MVPLVNDATHITVNMDLANGRFYTVQGSEASRRATGFYFYL